MPVFAMIPGYYPGKRLGFGGRESIAMMQQWCQWAKTGSFDFDKQSGRADKVAQFSGPLLSISFERDQFASDAALDRAVAPFVNSSVTRIRLGEKQQGEYLGHTGWAKSPAGVVTAVREWISQNIA